MSDTQMASESDTNCKSGIIFTIQPMKVNNQANTAADVCE